MEIKRVSPTEITIKSETPIYTMGDKTVVAVAEKPIKSFQAYFK